MVTQQLPLPTPLYNVRRASCPIPTLFHPGHKEPCVPSGPTKRTQRSRLQDTRKSIIKGVQGWGRVRARGRAGRGTILSVHLAFSLSPPGTKANVRGNRTETVACRCEGPVSRRHTLCFHSAPPTTHPIKTRRNGHSILRSEKGTHRL